MASTVRIHDEDKKTLESLINYVAFKTNKKITQEEMISLLVRAGLQDKDKLLNVIESSPVAELDWRADPIFTVKRVKMGKDASRAAERELYNR